MFCEKCGSQIKDGGKFCGICGSPVMYAQPDNDNAVMNTKIKPKQNNFSWNFAIAVSIVAVFMIALTGGFMWYNLKAGNDGESNIVSEVATERVSERRTRKSKDERAAKRSKRSKSYSDEAPPEVEEVPIAERTVRYDSSLTYKRMSEIHSSYSVGDDVFYEIQKVILTFDVQCEEYMNGDTSVVPPYLKYNSTAYNQQTDYKKKHPNLTQRFLNVEIDDARSNGEYYYAWVREDLETTENGVTKSSTDYWVYKLEFDGFDWCIVDYTSDPAAK